MTGVASGGAALALLGGTPVGSLASPRYPVFSERAKRRVAQLLDQGPMLGLSKQSPPIGDVETALARYHGVAHALGTSSGHGALHAALIGLELADGDEIVTSPYSWGVSVSTLLHNGCVPRFADVDPVTGLLDPASLEAAITERTAGILVPHIYGQPADMTRIMAIAGRRGLAVIEDGSQAHGARHQGRIVGSFGDAAGFSCNGVKPIGTSEAGFMLAREEQVYWKAVVSVAHAGGGELAGRASEPGFPDALREAIDSLVYTYRLSTLNAVLVREQLEKLEAENAGRRANLARLRAGLAGIGSVALAPVPAGDEPAVHMATLAFDAEHAGVRRETYLAALRAEGVGAVVYLARPLHRLPRLSPDWDGPRVVWTGTLRRAGADPTAVRLPGAERMAATSIQLPWNFVDEDPALIDRFVAAFAKVEANLDALRRHEAEGGGQRG